MRRFSDGAAQAVVHGQKVQAAFLPGLAQQPSELLGGGDRPYILVVAPASSSAAGPDHVLSPHCPVAQAYLFTVVFRHSWWSAVPPEPQFRLHRRGPA